MRKPNLLWISNASMGKSETFLRATHEFLKDHTHLTSVFLPSFKQRRREKIRHGILRKIIPPKPYYTDFNKYDKIWIEYGTTLLLISEKIAHFKGKLFIFLHGYDISAEVKNDDYAHKLVHLSQKVDLVYLVASRHNRNRLIVLGVRQNQIQVLRLPLNSEEIKPQGLEKTKYPSFVFFGRLTEKKNPVLLLHAFHRVNQRISSSKLTFIGSGPLRRQLENLALSLDLANQIHFLDSMERDDALKLIEQHWIYCQHSVTSSNGDAEGFALSPAEAALLKLPVVSTIHNGIPEHVIDQHTGFLVPEWDIDLMAERMIELASKPELIEEFGNNGRSNVSEICSYKRWTEAMHSLLLTP